MKYNLLNTQVATLKERKKSLAPHLDDLIKPLERVRKRKLSNKKTLELLEDLALAPDYYILEGFTGNHEEIEDIQNCAGYLQKAIPILHKMLAQTAYSGNKYLSMFLTAQDESADYQRYSDIDLSKAALKGKDNLEGFEPISERMKDLLSHMEWFITLSQFPSTTKKRSAAKGIFNKQLQFIEYLAEVWHDYTRKTASTTTNYTTHQREGAFVTFVCQLSRLIDPKTKLDGEQIHGALRILKSAGVIRKKPAKK